MGARSEASSGHSEPRTRPPGAQARGRREARTMARGGTRAAALTGAAAPSTFRSERRLEPARSGSFDHALAAAHQAAGRAIPTRAGTKRRSCEQTDPRSMALRPSAKRNAGTPCAGSDGQARRPVALALGLRALTDRAVPARGAHVLGAFARSLQSAAPRAVVLWGSDVTNFREWWRIHKTLTCHMPLHRHWVGLDCTGIGPWTGH